MIEQLLSKQLPLDEPGSFTQQLSMSTSHIPSAGGDVLSDGFESLGMKEDKIENAQQVKLKIREKI